MTFSTATLSVPARPDLPATTVALPWDWRGDEALGNSGVARLDIRFRFDGEQNEPKGLFFTRIGNRAEIRLNGQLLARYGTLDAFNGANYAKAPRFVPVPVGLLRPDNVLSIHVGADSGRHAGLSEVVFGAADLVRNSYFASSYVWRIFIGSVSLMALSLLVGVVALLLWQTQRIRPVAGRAGGRDAFYLYAGLTELGWAMYLANSSIQFVPFAWPWWGLLVLLARDMAVFGMLALLRHVTGRSRAGGHLRWPRVRWLFVASAGAALAAWYSGYWAILIGWYVLESALLLWLAGGYLWLAFRRGGHWRQRWLALALLAGVLAACHDWVMAWLGAGPSQAFALQYAALFQGIVLCCLIVVRFNAVTAQRQRLLVLLSQRLRMRERKLRASYERLAHAEREQARALERARVMRDMHDGVGLHLSTAIRQMSVDAAGQDEVLRTLRDALDQLKLSIDVMHMAPGDVTGLLSSLRFRLEPRLAAAGLALQWDVREIEPLADLDAERMRQLQYIVFAAVANVLQHARARTLRIAARDVDDGLLVSIADDGVGLDQARLQGKEPGRSMQARASEYGWRLEVTTMPPPAHGTRVDIWLPRMHGAAAGSVPA